MLRDIEGLMPSQLWRLHNQPLIGRCPLPTGTEYSVPQASCSESRRAVIERELDQFNPSIAVPLMSIFQYSRCSSRGA